jgi:hypothetical protein
MHTRSVCPYRSYEKRRESTQQKKSRTRVSQETRNKSQKNGLQKPDCVGVSVVLLTTFPVALDPLRPHAHTRETYEQDSVHARDIRTRHTSSTAREGRCPSARKATQGWLPRLPAPQRLATLCCARRGVQWWECCDMRLTRVVTVILPSYRTGRVSLSLTNIRVGSLLTPGHKSVRRRGRGRVR